MGTVSSQVLVVGGGGSSNHGVTSNIFPSGGAGAVPNYDATHVLTLGASYPVTVGIGGVAPSGINDAGTNGTNSVFDTLTSIGGGHPPTFNSPIGGTNSSFIGGTGTGPGGNFSGGGGAGGGGNGSTIDGGHGLQFSISGSSVGYGGGGASAVSPLTSGNAFDGGGDLNSHPRVNSGGGGAAIHEGADGIVIISYATPSGGGQDGTGGTITHVSGNTIHTFTSSGTFVAPTFIDAPILNNPTMTTDSALLSWSLVATAISYEIQYGVTSGVYTHAISPGNVTSYTLSGLVSGQKYFFVVNATDGTNLSSNSNEVSGTTQGVLTSQSGVAQGLFGFNPDAGCFELMVMEGDTLSGWPSSGVIIPRKNGFQSLPVTMIKAGQQAQLDVLIINNGYDSFVMYQDHTFYDLLDTVYSCPKTRAISYYGDRLWALKNNLASFSDAFPPTYYPTAAKIAGDQTTYSFTTGDAIKLTIDGIVYDEISLSGASSILDVINILNAAFGYTIASIGLYPDSIGVLVITSTTLGTASNVSIDDATSMKTASPVITCIGKLFFGTSKTASGYAPFDRAVNAFRVPVGEARAIVATRDQGLVFFGGDQIWQLLPSQIPNPTTDIPQKVLDIGCVAAYTCVQVADDIIFLAADGVRGLFRTQLDKLQTGQSFPLSWSLEDQFNDISWPHIDKACAIFFENKYIIALPTNGSNYNNICWVYYPSLSTSFYSSNNSTQQSASRSWVVYTGWNIARFAVMNIGGKQNLYGVDSLTGNVFQLFKGTSDDGNAINYDYISKAEDYKAPMQYKLGGEFKIKAFGANATINVSARADDGDFISLGSISLPATGITFPTLFPVNFTNSQEVSGTFHLDDNGISKFKRVEFETTCAVKDAELAVIETLATAFQEPYLSE